jgi:hypothetical protein
MPIGSALLATTIGAVGQIGANKRNRRFQLDMYNRQRKDALADRDFALAYNTPLAQRKRLEEAGLNPALMYGSSPQNTAVDTRGASTSQGQSKNIIDPLTFATLEKLGAETRAIELDNDYKDQLYNYQSRGTGPDGQHYSNKAMRDAQEQIKRIEKLELEKAYTGERYKQVKLNISLLREQIKELERLNKYELIRGIDWKKDAAAIVRRLGSYLSDRRIGGVGFSSSNPSRKGTDRRNY